MERTKKTKEVDASAEKKVEFRKTGGGTFRLANGRIIKPGQVFKVYPSQIPKSFRDSLLPLQDLPPSPEERKIDVADPNYSLVARGGGWFNVVDANGKVMNQKALKQAEADKLLDDLTSA